jgi:tetratricopeptide (TPR) repeat protein
MTMKILFYPTSPVHVRNISPVIEALPDSRLALIVSASLRSTSPLLEHEALASGHGVFPAASAEDLARILDTGADVVLIGAVFEPLALELIRLCLASGIPVVGIEEVAQLSLNQLEINNYDAPFDVLFVASREEARLFRSLGYPEERLKIAGLLSHDPDKGNRTAAPESLKKALGIDPATGVITYTTSPVRTRKLIHNRDDDTFRKLIVQHLEEAARAVNRRLIVKLHPNEDPEGERRRIRQIAPAARVISGEADFRDVLLISDVVVNRGNSQTCLDAALAGVNVIVLSLGMRTVFHEYGGAIVVDEIDDLTTAIEKALPPARIDIRQLSDHCGCRPAGQPGEAIAAEISRLAGSRRRTDPRDWIWLVKSYLFHDQRTRANDLCHRLRECDSVWIKRAADALRSELEGNRRDAARHWMDCSAIDPAWYFPHYQLAYLNFDDGNYPFAIDHARSAIRLHPPFHRLWHEVPMRVLISAAHRKQGRPDLALEELQSLEAGSLGRMLPEVLIEKAYIFHGQARPAEALDSLCEAQRLIRTCPVRETLDGELVRRIEIACEELGLRRAKRAWELYRESLSRFSDNRYITGSWRLLRSMKNSLVR